MDPQLASRKRSLPAEEAQTATKRQAISENPENTEPNDVGADQKVVEKPIQAAGRKPRAKKPRAVKAKATKPKRKGREGKIENTLESLGVEHPEGVSRCLKAAISRGHIKILPPEKDPNNEHGLDQVILTAPCIECNKTISCTIRDVLFQSDYAGTDYEEGGMDAPFKCKAKLGGDDSDEESHDSEEKVDNLDESEDVCGIGIYVTRMCTGKPVFDSGKFHNHCNRCRGLGKCIGDYRETHCERCGKHYFQGSMGTFPCSCRQRRGFGFGRGSGFGRGLALFDEDGFDEDGSDEEEDRGDCSIM